MQGVGIKTIIKEFKNVFAWTYKDSKGIPLELAQHRIDLITTLPLVTRSQALC